MVGIGKTIRFPVPRTELYKQSVRYISSKLWNGLNEKVRNLNILSDFNEEIGLLF